MLKQFGIDQPNRLQNFDRPALSEELKDYISNLCSHIQCCSAIWG